MNVVPMILDQSMHFISSGGILIGFLLVFIECFIPALPLSVFVTFNVNIFGFFYGFIISWMATCFGSYLCYDLFLHLGNKISDCFFRRKTVIKIIKALDHFQNIQFTELVLLLTLPFTPSSFINMMAGLTKYSKEQYFLALLIGKSFSIAFWGYIGKSVLDSLTDIYSIVYIVLSLLFAYVISKMICLKMRIE